ncbi:uncharacterized protein [Coffea arabica]|uniref:DDE Tnp4 domain-containing protein n=1 Tax=Coffea arabica TaxID=13443 RepID=A0A6P6WZV2_COFAR|nr:putative nuclease HARBI1 [Coffea arabica]
MEYEDYLQGGDFFDEGDEEEILLTFIYFVLAGLALFDPYLNPVERRRIRDGAQSGAQWDCVGAIDGTHVSAWCRAEDRERYQNRHGGLSQNILAVCDHNMRFTYVRVGWEGSAHDSRILKDVLLDPNCAFPRPPEGKYYAVDAAYMNMPGFMAPFRGARGTQQERAARTLFNRRHASLRGIIERTFGVLKKRFPILKGPMQNYLMATQNNIVLACCALHNFMRDNVPNDAYFVEEETIAAQADNINHVVDQMAGTEPLDMSPQGIAGWNEFRSALANSMYYHQH